MKKRANLKDQSLKFVTKKETNLKDQILVRTNEANRLTKMLVLVVLQIQSKSD